MKRSFKMLAAALFAAAALFTGTALQAQDKPAGGFKNAFLNMGKSGKVSLTYTLWDEQVKKGNYTLCFFWASWSDEAREQLPYVKEVHKKYAGKLKVLGVTYGDEITDSMEAIPEWGIPFPSFVFVEDAAPDGQFDIDSIPLVILFGPDGSVVARDLKGEEIEEAITSLLSH